MKSKLSPELEEAVREAAKSLHDHWCACDKPAPCRLTGKSFLRSLVLRATQETAKRIADLADARGREHFASDIRKEFNLDY